MCAYCFCHTITVRTTLTFSNRVLKVGTQDCNLMKNIGYSLRNVNKQCLISNYNIKMYRKLMWCYVFVLTLLDLSLNSKLTAQGKSHGVTVHDSLVEGITFQEWGSESEAGGGAGSGRALPPASLRADPPALALGRAPLGAAHAATVTLTNTANTTMHLASIAGTTPDFHASFFDSKTLACGANTSFSVVFLGRREGLVSQHLYIHTSLGVLKYPVSAVGVGSEWALWPLVGVRVPHNATLRPLLTMHNPTDHTVQVVEMYSSAGWLGLQLPEGGASAPRAHWQLPPRSSRALVRLRLRTPAPHKPGARHDTRAAYIRIKANVTGPPLVVLVEAAAAPAGAHADPLQLRAGTRGAQDAPYTFSISLGNSETSGAALWGGAWGACGAAPHAPPPPAAADAPRANGAHHAANGAGAEGARLSLLRAQLEPLQEPAPAAQLTLDFAKLWAGAEAEAEAEADAEAGAGADERWCAGWAALAGGALPYSVRLLPGTLRMSGDLHFVTADEEGCMRAQEVRARNEFSRPVRLVAVDLPPDLLHHFHAESFAPLSLAPGEERAVARLRLRRRDVAAILDSNVTVLTNLTHTRYAVPVKLYSGDLDIEWQWPGATATELALGALATSSTRRVLARVRNPAPAPLCVSAHAALPGATLSLSAEGGCIAAGGSAGAVLTVVAPARAGAVRGAVWLQAPRARATTHVTLRALPGAVRAFLVHERANRVPEPEELAAAPWASGWAPTLVVESSMALRMRLTRVEPQPPDPALVFIPAEDEAARWIAAGTSRLGHVAYLPERACGAACYTGRALGTPAAWLRAPLDDDLRLLAQRRALYDTEMLRPVRNVTLALDTTEMVRIPVVGYMRVGWPRLSDGEAGWAGLAGVGAGAARWLRVRNPAPHPLALHARVAAARPLPPGALIETEACAQGACVYSAGVFSVSKWRAPRGGVAPLMGGEGGEGGVALLLAPRAELELRVDFLPPAPDTYTAVLYLRNNLTIVEAVQLGGRGAVPSFELAGRRAHAHQPILLQVTDCEEGRECAAESPGGEEAEAEEDGRWVVRRTVLARNTGAVPLRLRAWRLAGEPCRARGFRLAPCASLALAPNETRALTLTFRADCTLARVACPLALQADSGPAAFRLLAVVPARLLPACRAALPRPPWEPALRAAGALLAVAALALVLAAAALDAERLLRRARDARAAPPSRAPLDLRALARAAPPPPPPPPPPPRARRRPARRPQPAPDPHAERRAFERWRAEVLRRDSPHVEGERDGEEEPARAEPAPPSPPPSPPPDESDAEPDVERDAEDAPRSSGDDDAASGGSDSSSPPASPLSPTARSCPPRAADAPPTPPRAPAPECARAGPAPSPSPAPATAPAPRPRRDAASPSRRAEPPARPRAALGKHHTRKDKVSKRRGSGTGASSARVSPPQSSPRATPAPQAGGGALRWGASWSSVVAAGAAPASPRAAPPPPPPAVAVAAPPPQPAPTPPSPRADHSLFYFNDAHALRAQPTAPDAEFAWRADRSPYDAPPPPPLRDYRVPDDGHNGSNAYGTIGSGWGGVGVGGVGVGVGGVGVGVGGAGALWAGGVRPPPGFGPRAAPPPVRAFDPFHSLASIWAPAAFDWRAEPRERDH